MQKMMQHFNWYSKTLQYNLNTNLIINRKHQYKSIKQMQNVHKEVTHVLDTIWYNSRLRDVQNGLKRKATEIQNFTQINI